MDGYGLRVGRTDWAKGALDASNTLDGAHAPLVFARSVTLDVLSSAAEVGGGEVLLRGHLGGLYEAVRRRGARDDAGFACEGLVG